MTISDFTQQLFSVRPFLLTGYRI